MTESTYTVRNMANCTIITGGMPVSDFVALTSKAPKKSVMSPDMANRFGANFVFGLPEDLLKLATMAPLRQVNVTLADTCGLTEGAREWIRSGEHGLSSLYLLYAVTGYYVGAKPPKVSAPCDPDDLRRCLLMLNACGLNNDIYRAECKEWTGLLENWELIAHTFAAECPNYLVQRDFGRASKTYELMKQALSNDDE